jgi:hypothetical protein
VGRAGVDIEHAGPSYDDQRAILRLLDDVEPQHMLVLRALAEQPRPEEMSGMLGSITGILQRRLPGLPAPRIDELVISMNDFRIINLTSNRMHTTMTAGGAADLRSTISPSGHRLISFIRDSSPLQRASMALTNLCRKHILLYLTMQDKISYLAWKIKRCYAPGKA